MSQDSEGAATRLLVHFYNKDPFLGQSRWCVMNPETYLWMCVRKIRWGRATCLRERVTLPSHVEMVVSNSALGGMPCGIWKDMSSVWTSGHSSSSMYVWCGDTVRSEVLEFESALIWLKSWGVQSESASSWIKITGAQGGWGVMQKKEAPAARCHNHPAIK